MNTTTSLPKAKDLMQEPPRSPRDRIGGYALIARMIDKGRATINGTNGEYHFNCPLDNMLFEFKGVDGEDVRKVLQSGANDEEVARWITEHGTKKTPEEIKAWADSLEKFSFYNVPEKREWFVEESQRLGLDPARTTHFEYLETDDRVSYQR
jgi:hypothetical protein